MRRFGGYLVLLILCGVFGANRATAASGDCSFTNCGMYCITQGEFAGFCTPPTIDTTGCIQLYAPGCVSMENAYCCRSHGSAF